MPMEANKIEKYNHGEMSMKLPFIIYPDFEFLLEKISNCHNNPEKSSTTKIINMHPLVIYCLHIVHLIYQKSA